MYIQLYLRDVGAVNVPDLMAKLQRQSEPNEWKGIALWMSAPNLMAVVKKYI